ncbi:MAG: bifunctional folylpolyglutamate synthase/dihydrofolate synthase [Fusobacteriaceae bacterium]
MKKLTIEQITEEIFNYGFFGKKAGLSNISEILTELENPQKSYKIIHIAGTNGKGSVATTLEAILKEGNYRVGKFVSPHISKVNERINLNGVPISDDDFIEHYKIIKAVLKKLDLVPTFFEFITALMFNYFKEKKIDYLILEVGLGGRLDSTNVADADVAVITNISLDHINELGGTLEKIAFEKSGIIKEKSKVVIGEWNERTLSILETVTKEKQFKSLTFTKRKYSEISSYKLDFENFLTRIQIMDKKFDFSLFGEHQYENFLTAYEVSKLLNICDLIIEKAVKKVYWQCRFEVFKKSQKIVVLDGAHNIEGVIHLKNTLLKHYTPKDIITITSILSDKEIKPMLKEMSSFSEELVLTSLEEIKRGISGQKIKEIAGEICKTKITVLEDIVESYNYAINSNKKIIVICGSFYLLSKIKEVIESEDK